MRYLLLLVVIATGCATKETKTIGSIERMDAGLDNLISASATLEIIGEGFKWSEGPVWVEKKTCSSFRRP
ncbi:MAG: hypothetical protein U5K54_02395 [Cytophagales bacterium]|nr:hypothetical protein [Cytophagales bacterium]